MAGTDIRSRQRREQRCQQRYRPAGALGASPFSPVASVSGADDKHVYLCPSELDGTNASELPILSVILAVIPWNEKPHRGKRRS